MVKQISLKLRKCPIFVLGGKVLSTLRYILVIITKEETAPAILLINFYSQKPRFGLKQQFAWDLSTECI